MAAEVTPREEAEAKGELFDLLSNHRRRWTVHLCKQAGEPLELGDLAERIAAMEQDIDVSEISSAERKRVYTSLQQTHLPRMDEAGIITFEDHTVTLTERANQLQVYMDIVPAGSIPWAMYYLALATISLVAVAFVWAGWLDSILSAQVVALLIVLLFGISAGIHAYTNRQYRLGSDNDPL